MLSHFPRSLQELEAQIKELFHMDLGFRPGEKEFFAARIWQLMTSCHERRMEEYERIGWWEYVGAESRSEAYQTYLGRGLTRTLVAAKAEEASTKTGGDIFIQLLFNMADPMIEVDRILDGPTNEVWIDPWLSYLETRGVRYHFDSVVTRFACEGGKIRGVYVSQHDGPEELVAGDYYVAAVPIEVMARLLSDEMLAIDESLTSLKTLAGDVAWMNGLQIYLNERADISRGHVIYPNTPWALTSISQPQFWRDFDIADYGPGTVRDLLSIDISDWETKMPGGLAASECTTNQEVFDGVWAQLKAALNQNGVERLRDDQVVAWYLDGDISFSAHFPVERTPAQTLNPSDPHAYNAEPLLVNKVDTWVLRPQAETGIPNLFLASDYVQTYTDLATMEGANEAARRAVNAVIEAAGAKVSRCKLWPLHEPSALAPFRWIDAWRYRRGLPWQGEFTGVVRLLKVLAGILSRFRPNRVRK
jgi:uncharacterized protein with NAD-binding domain and iron-sulfur cluster